MTRINQHYFKSILEKYLNEKHPEIVDKVQLLENRSLRALQTYRELSRKGATHETALECATLELTDGFGFSLYQFLYDLVSADFTEIPDETRRDFCISILPECLKISESLNYDNMEEWEAYYHFEEKMGEAVQNRLK
jgi:hypothetical protein